jgi:hypothetical protein
MKLDSSKKGYSNIIAGILVIVVLSIFMVFLIGFWGNGISEQSGHRAPMFLPLCSGDPSEESISGYNKIESIAQCGSWKVDVEKGYMNNVQVSWDGSYDLPICTTPTDVMTDWVLTIDVYGGYDPCTECDNYFHIYQQKNDEGALLHGVYMIDPTYFKWTSLGLTAPCGPETWQLTFENIPDVGGFALDADGDLQIDPEELIDCMLFDSNHKPFECKPGKCHLDKFVTFDLCTCWQGCPCPTQKFVKILIHKNYVSGVPNSRLKNFIAS